MSEGHPDPTEHSHVACCDESYVLRGRFRGVAAVSTRVQDYCALRRRLRTILNAHRVRELKWNKLNGKSRLDAAADASRLVLEEASGGTLRLDVLVWDTHDSRHGVAGRDDLANLHRMYHHLLFSVMGQRWPEDSRWLLVPDASTCLRPGDIHHFLSLKELTVVTRDTWLFEEGPSAMWRRLYRVTNVSPESSSDNELVQVADIAAGMAVFARESYGDYEHWCASYEPQQRLWHAGPPIRLSNTGRYRFPLMYEFNRLCKEHKMRVSLRTQRGFRTMDPRRPVNFWWYEPQHGLDKAPGSRC